MSRKHLKAPNGDVSLDYSPTRQALFVKAREFAGYAQPNGYGDTVKRFGGDDLQLALDKALVDLGLTPAKLESTPDFGNSYEYSYKVQMPSDPAQTRQILAAFEGNVQAIHDAHAEGGAQALQALRQEMAADVRPALDAAGQRRWGLNTR